MGTPEPDRVGIDPVPPVVEDRRARHATAATRCFIASHTAHLPGGDYEGGGRMPTCIR
jgi:hypothetical protein